MEGETLYCYFRKSKKNSNEGDDGYSIQYQKDIAFRVKERFGFDTVVIFNEGDGISGDMSIFERNESKKLVDLINQGKIKHLYAYEYSRLSRNSYDSEYLRKIMREKKVLFYEGDCKKVRDLSDPIDKLTAGILGAIYTYERDNLIKRIKAGLRASRDKKRWSGNFLPYGYKRNPDTREVEVCEREMPVYLSIVELAEKGKSVRWIVNYLNESGIPTKMSTVLKKRGYIERKNKNGQIIRTDVSSMIWRDNVIRNILKNTYYKGVRIEKYDSSIEHPFPKIIDKERWDKLQNLLEKNIVRNRSGNKPKYKYLLKNLMWHKHENENFKMLGKWKKGEKTYYCNGKLHQIRKKGEPPCSLPSPNILKLEKFVWNKLLDIISDSKLVREEYKKQFLGGKTLPERRVRQKKIVQKLSSKIEEIEKKEKMLLDLYLEGDLSKDVYQGKHSSIKDELKDKKHELVDGQETLKILESEKSFIRWNEDFVQLIEEWREFDREKDFDEMRNKVEEYINSIFIDYNKEDNTYDLILNFKLPMVGDKLIWRDETQKMKLGYDKIENGDKTIHYNIDKSTYQDTHHIRLRLTRQKFRQLP